MGPKVVIWGGRCMTVVSLARFSYSKRGKSLVIMKAVLYAVISAEMLIGMFIVYKTNVQLQTHS